MGRTERQAQKWRKKLERYREIQREIQSDASDILGSRNFYRMKEHIQHGNVTVNAHVMAVARYSVALSDRLHISCNAGNLLEERCFMTTFYMTGIFRTKKNHIGCMDFTIRGLRSGMHRKNIH